MKKIFKITITGLFLITGAVAFSAKIQAGLTTETPASTAAGNRLSEQKNGSARTLYLNNCARCHGADGKAETELGKLYDATDLTQKKVKKMSRKKVTRIVQNGDGSMPAFKKKLSTKEIGVLVNYIRTL